MNECAYSRLRRPPVRSFRRRWERRHGAPFPEAKVAKAQAAILRGLGRTQAAKAKQQVSGP